MRHQPKILNLSGNTGVERWAVGKYRLLERARQAAGVPLLERRYLVDGITFLIQACSLSGGKIIMMGCGADILLSSETQAGLFAYKGKITRSSANLGIDWLKGGAQDVVYSSNNFKASGLKKFSAVASEISGQPLGYDITHQLVLWHDGEALATVVEGERRDLARFELPGFEIPGVSATMSGTFLYLPRRHDSDWNYYSPVNHWAFNPSTGLFWSTGYWQPSFFYVFPADPWYYHGWHYGKYKDWWESSPDDGRALTEAEVWFGAYLEARDPGATVKWGYCEVLVNLAGEDRFDLNFFLGSSPVKDPGNPSEVYLSLTTTKYGGTKPSGFERTASLSLYSVFGKPMTYPEIHFWGFDSFVQETTMTVDVDAFGLVVAVDNKAVGYRYKGYWKKIFETENYHSHSVSHDGNILALFEGADFIETVSAWDMFNPETEELCLQSDVSASLFAVGEIIPVTELQPLALSSYSPLSFPVLEDPSVWYAPNAVVSLPDQGNGQVSANKLECDGRKATLHQYIDPCMTSEVTLYRAPSAGAEVSFTVEGVTYTGPFYNASTMLPKVLWSSVGAEGDGVPNEIVFARFSKGANGEMFVYDACSSASGVTKIVRTLNEVLTIGREITGSIVVSGVLGELVYGEGFTEEGEELSSGFKLYCECETYDHPLWGHVEFDDSAPCRKFKAESTCGQAGLYHEQTSPLGDISGDIAASVGTVYSIAGGKLPYSWNMQGMSYDEAENGTSVQITSTDGLCGVKTISVTDSCGKSSSMKVRLPIGQWVLVSTENHPGLCQDWIDAYSYLYSGEHRAISYFAWQRIGYSCDDCSWGPSFAVNSTPQYRISDDAPVGSGWQTLCQEKEEGIYDDRYIMQRAILYRWECP